MVGALLPYVNDTMSDTKLTAADLETLANNVRKGDHVEVTIRVGDQTDTVTLATLYTDAGRSEVGLSLPGDDRQYGKIYPAGAASGDDTEIRLVTSAEDQHNADVLGVEA